MQNNNKNQCFIVDVDDSNIRIDKYLSDEMQDVSRSRIQKLIENNLIKVNGKSIKSNYKVMAEDVIDVILPELEVPQIEPEDIPLDIVYEDNDIIVVNKPKGMVVHPAAGHYTGTLVNALMYHCLDNLSGINGVLRPGIVHRIDMNTTGVLVACKNDYSHNFIAEQLSVDAESVTEASSFKEDLGADSLDLFELVMALEDEYSVEIPAEELEKMSTVGDVMEYLKNHGVEA